MHPIYLRRSRLVLYVLAMLGFGELLTLLLHYAAPLPLRQAHAFAMPLAMLYGFGVLSAWWTCRQHPLTEGGLGRAVFAQLNTAWQAAGLWALIGAAWGAALARLWPGGSATPGTLHSIGLLFVVGVPLYLVSVLAHYLLLTVEESHAAARRVLESQVTAREAELRALRAQLNPHFLFNSLNSINALVGSDPEGARRMCEGLGDFLRRTLSLGARDAVTLEEELALVDRYLAIEQVRFGERLRIERTIEPAAMPCLLPPLLLQPLVENAIKHGVASRIEGGTVQLTARRRDGRLWLAIENPLDADTPLRPGTGMGLENVRRRLAVFGARAATLDAVRGERSFRVTLDLAVRESPDPEVAHA